MKYCLNDEQKYIIENLSRIFGKTVFEIQKGEKIMSNVKHVNGKMIFRNSFSESTFDIWVNVKDHENKTFTIYSASVDAPDLQFNVDDIIDVIFQAYRKSSEVEE